MFCAGSFLPMALQVLVKEFVGYSALFLRTIEGKPTCPQYHKLDPYKSCLVHTLDVCLQLYMCSWADTNPRATPR